MSVQECLVKYREMAKKVFTPVDQGKFKHLMPHLPGRPSGKFSGDVLAKAVGDIVGEVLIDREAVFENTECCATYVNV